MTTPKFGALFGRDQKPERAEDQERMLAEIEKLGGMLHFSIQKDEDGWSAQCKEIPGIITGGSNADPEDFEIQSNIREAIHTAFHVKTTTDSPIRIKSEVTQLAMSFA